MKRKKNITNRFVSFDISYVIIVVYCLLLCLLYIYMLMLYIHIILQYVYFDLKICKYRYIESMIYLYREKNYSISEWANQKLCEHFTKIAQENHLNTNPIHMSQMFANEQTCIGISFQIQIEFRSTFRFTYIVSYLNVERTYEIH